MENINYKLYVYYDLETKKFFYKFKKELDNIIKYLIATLSVNIATTTENDIIIKNNTKKIPNINELIQIHYTYNNSSVNNVFKILKVQYR